MHVFSSLIQYIKLRRAPTTQKQTALQMLVVSGVVRSSHAELHYATPFARITAFRAQPTATLRAPSSETPSLSSLRVAGGEEHPSVRSGTEP
jgi:hypothetical protein